VSELFQNLSEGIAAASGAQALLYLSLGTLLGILIGAAPGIGPTIGMAVMLPVAVRLSPENAVFLLVSITVGAAFGNSLTSILVGVPGSPAALLTVVEGHPLHLRGEGGRALQIALVSSVLGQLAGVILFIAFVVPLANIAVRLLLPEQFGIVMFGIVTAAGLVTRSPWKGIAAIALGLLLAIPGQDAITGQSRFTFGWGYLQSGLPEIPVIMGLLAFKEIFAAAAKGPSAFEIRERPEFKFQPWLPGRDWRAITIPVIVGTTAGLIIGIVPGAGAMVGSFVAYQAIKMLLRRHTDWGRGSIAGLAAVDSAQNSGTTGELIPTLALGIPGAPAMVILMAALATQGIYAGPQLARDRPELLYNVFGGLLIGVLLLAVLGYASISPAIYLSTVSPAVTMALTMVLIVVGSFALRWQLLDVWMSIGFGLLAYFLERYGYPIAPMALAFILGRLLEQSLRRGLIMTHGWGGFLSRPLTLALLVVALMAFVGGIQMNRRMARRAAQDSALRP